MVLERLVLVGGVQSHVGGGVPFSYGVLTLRFLTYWTKSSSTRFRDCEGGAQESGRGTQGFYLKL